jgi:SAM-dependent methyltransferase
MTVTTQASAFYRNNVENRSGAVSHDRAAAAAYYERYVRFIAKHLPRGASLLELGSSTGMAADCFARAGYRTTASDLCHPSFRRDLRGPMLRFIGADGGRLPFRDASFDAVASYQTLEHVPDAAVALDEMIRVVRPRGWVFVAGPNLLGVVPSLHVLLSVIPRRRPVRAWFRSGADPVRYPFGSTYPEACAILVRNAATLLAKALDPNVRFMTRTPDFRGSMHADADSTYLLNPIDIVRYLRRRGFRIATTRGDGPFAFLGPLAGGTWVAARRR